MKPGHWATHEYKRESVMNIPRFCGWETLAWIIKAADMTQYRTDQAEYLRQRDQALISALFETGGRVREVLMLRKENFAFQTDKVLVMDMPVLKRFEKARSWIEKRKELPKNCMARLYQWDDKKRCYWRKRWETKPKFSKRQDFTIWLAEPLSHVLIGWVRQTQDYLFPAYRKSKQRFLVESRAYTIVRTVEENFNTLVEEGKINLPKVRLYDHWFRGMRASQLVKDYHYDEFRLKRFFAWERSDMAFHYAHVGVEELEEAWKETEDMKKAKSLF